MVAAMPLRTLEAPTSRGPTPIKQQPRRGERKRLLLIGAAGVAALLLLLVVTRNSNQSDKVSATKTTSTTGPDGSLGVDAPQIAGPGAGTGSKPAYQATKPGGASGASPVQKIPLNVKVSNTHNLQDGDVVHVHVTPEKGSLAYGLEARLCESGPAYNFETDMRPTIGGKCVSKPLSSRSDDYVAAKGAPPYASVDLDFRVGTGADSFQTQSGRSARVMCGAGNPCTLVLELQFPDGYGFQTIPLTFR
jgi:hypothetical protein